MSEPPHGFADQAPTAPSRRAWFAFGLVVLATLWLLTRGWHASLLDRHEFRQLQTAVTAYWMKGEGFRLDYPLPLFGPPWSAPMEFPLYQEAVALFSRVFSLPLEPAGRAMGILFFLAALPALYGVLGLAGLSPARRLLTLGLLLGTPVYLFYSRCFMIESAALALAAWFLFAWLRGVLGADWRWGVAAVVTSALAALVKVTTFAVFGTVGVVWVGWSLAREWRHDGRHPGAGRLAAALLPVAAAAGAGAWWVRFSDAIKRSNPFSEFLTSGRLAAWNFGTWRQRLDPTAWRQIYDNVNLGVLSEGGVTLLLLGLFLIDRRHRRAALLTASGFLVGPLLFTNLYVIHDYYLYANGLFLIGAAGWIMAGVLDAPALPRAGRIAAVAVFAGVQLLAFVRGYGDYYVRTLPAPPALAAVIRAAVPPDEVVLIDGWQWNTVLPYYAERRVIMLPDHRDEDLAHLDHVFAQLAPYRLTALIWKGEGAPPKSLLHWCEDKAGIAPLPAAQSADGWLYLSPAGLQALQRHLADHLIPNVTFNLAQPADKAAVALSEQVFAPGALAGYAQPEPFKARSQHGIALGGTSDAPALIAHATSELYFHPPPGARRIHATVVLDPASYTRTPGTDGVDVEIDEERSDGLRRCLYRRSLNPAAVEADRGPQAIEIAADPPLTGEIVFRVGPGAAGNEAYDWCSWGRIVIE